MNQVLPIEEVLQTLQDCQKEIERLSRVLGVVSPEDMDQHMALKALSLRCLDSVYTINLWSRRRPPELKVVGTQNVVVLKDTNT